MMQTRSEADNFAFEERASAARIAAFEAEISTVRNWRDLRRAHIDYWSEYIRTDVSIPQTFNESLEPSSIDPIDDDQKIVRIESLVRPMLKAGITFVELENAHARSDHALVSSFLRTWSSTNIRDSRPVFATFLDEIQDELHSPDWPNRLRDRLGLAHYDCNSGEIPICLFEYTVREVRQKNRLPTRFPFTVPTAFDSVPWCHFFPSPQEINYGRTMALHEVFDDNLMLSELLHVRFDFEPKHLSRLGKISKTPASFDLRQLRNSHLFALQVSSGRDNFGEQIA